MSDKDEQFVFMDAAPSLDETTLGDPWLVIMVDDDSAILKTSKRVLNDFIFEGRPLAIKTGQSAQEAKQIIKENPDVAVILLDVIMETDEAGLDVVNYVRKELKNTQVRILLRTGQAGQFDEEEVFEFYDINDFLEKSELTSRRLKTSLKVALRAYRMQDEINTILLREMSLREAADVANKVKSEFLANMSHELRSPMTSIKSGLSTIKEVLEEPEIDEEDMQDALTSVGYAEDSANRLMALLNSILDLSKLEAGKVDFIFKDVDMKELIESAYQEIKPQANNKSIRVVVQCDVANSIINLDYAKIFQVVINLLNNAVKFSPDNKQITISLNDARIVVGKRLTDEHSCAALELKVCDEGPGVPSDEHDAVFEQFTQSTKTNDGSGGTGLGLAIAKDIVRAHQGKITVENKPHAGACFIMALPKERVELC